MRHRWVWLGIGLTLGLGLTWLMFGRAPASSGPVIINNTAVPPVPTLDSLRTAQGERLYTQYCAACHGVNREGQPDWKQRLPDGSLPAPPHDNSGHTWHHPDAVLLNITANGGNAAYGDSTYNSKMPAFGEALTSDDILAILEYIKSHWGRDQREYQWWMTSTRDGP